MSAQELLDVDPLTVTEVNNEPVTQNQAQQILMSAQRMPRPPVLAGMSGSTSGSPTTTPTVTGAAVVGGGGISRIPSQVIGQIDAYKPDRTTWEMYHFKLETVFQHQWYRKPRTEESLLHHYDWGEARTNAVEQLCTGNASVEDVRPAM